MCPQKAIYDFLVQSDNLATAMEMANNVESFKLDMHKHFWSSFNAYMGQRVKSDVFNAEWKFSPYNTQRIRKDWEKSIIYHSFKEGNNQPLLQFVFAQGKQAGGYPLYWGVCWNNPPINFSSSALLSLNALLLSKNIMIPEPPKWIYWGWYKYRLYEVDFLVRSYLQNDELITEIVNDVFGLFCELQPLMEKINQELRPDS